MNKGKQRTKEKDEVMRQSNKNFKTKKKKLKTQLNK